MANRWSLLTVLQVANLLRTLKAYSRMLGFRIMALERVQYRSKMGGKVGNIGVAGDYFGMLVYTEALACPTSSHPQLSPVESTTGHLTAENRYPTQKLTVFQEPIDFLARRTATQISNP